MNIVSNGIRIHVEEQGQGELSLVFLHYWGGSSRTWRHVTTALAPSFRTVAVDHRGWGQSDAPMNGYGLDDLAADALGVIEALNLKSYVLVGHSMGGKVAQLLASRQPAGLGGLVLVAPSPPSPMAMPVEARERMAHAYASRQAIEMTLDHVLTARALSTEDHEQVIADSLSGSPQAKAAWPLHASQEDITAQVTAIRVPTLVIAGEDDRVDPPTVLREELIPRITQAELHVLPGVGHLSPLEAAGDLTELIRDFAMLVQLRQISAN